MLENNVENTEQQQAEINTEVEKPVEKTFSQDEVDKIVEKRLNRERKKFTSLLNGETPKEIELAEREKMIAEKELQLEMRGVLREKNIPSEAMELLNWKDKESCEKSIEILENIITSAANDMLSVRLRGSAPIKKAINAESDSIALKNAFGLN